MKYALLLLFFLLQTPQAFAQSTGFSKEAVWVSRTPVVEGQTVLIHASLTNGEKETLTGVLHFKDNEASVGDVSVSLKSGEARIFSISWTPKGAGTHAVSATIESENSKIATNAEKVTVNVKAAEVPEKQKAAASTSTSFTTSDPIVEKIESVSPAVSKTAAPLFSTIDSVRKSSSNFLAEKTTAQQGVVKGIHTEIENLNKKDTPEAKNESRKKTAYQVFATLLLYLYSTLLVVVSKAGYFYPVFFLLFFFILYKCYRRIRRPSYN